MTWTPDDGSGAGLLALRADASPGAAVGNTLAEVLARGADAHPGARSTVMPVRVPITDGVLPCFLKMRFSGPRGLKRSWKRLRGEPAANTAARELDALRSWREAGLRVPEPVAAGWEQRTREPSFLVLGALSGFAPISDRFRAEASRGASMFASLERLGRWVARVHSAGLRHGDLYAWHVFADERFEQFAAIDLARARQSVKARSVSVDLAGMLATFLNPMLDGPGGRAFLDAYWEAAPAEVRSERVWILRASSRRARVIAGRRWRRIAAL